MKRVFYTSFALMLALLPAPFALAADGDDSADLTARAAARLDELGYAHQPAAALTAESIEAILADEAFDEPLSYDALFASDADYAPLPDMPRSLAANAFAVEAQRVDFPTASGLLTLGASYALTDADTGAIVRLRCIEITDAFAAFAPLSVWDAATLGGVFNEKYDYRTEICALTIGETPYYAAVAVAPPDLDPDAGTPAKCRLYFDGGAPSLGAVTGVGLE